MPPQTWTFPWGIASLDAAPRHSDLSLIRANQWTLIADGAVLAVALHRPAPAAARGAIAETIGRAISQTLPTRGRPLPLTILIGLAMLAVHGQAPDAAIMPIARQAARVLPWTASADCPAESPPTPRRELRRAIDEAPALTASVIVETVRRISATPWDWARALVIIGESLWQRIFARDAARLLGRMSVTADLQPAHLALGLLPALAHPRRWRRLRIPLDADAHRGEVWLDWAAVAAGPPHPHPSLWTQGLGAALDHPLHTSNQQRALPWDAAERLAQTAAALLDERDRPLPRLIGQIVRIPLPADVLPVWTAWDVDSLVAQIFPDGMYLSLRTHADQSAAVVWWDAHPESVRWTPLIMPPAAWVLLHATAAAIWHDLGVDAITVTGAPNAPTAPHAASSSPAPLPPSPGRRGASERAAVSLPPLRTAALPGRWGETDDHARIRAAVARSAHYRRLPPDWAARQTRRDVQRRAAAAAERARQAGLPPPPPGYTFVRATAAIGVAPHDPAGAARPVRCRGLLALALLVREPEARVRMPRPDGAVPRSEDCR